MFLTSYKSPIGEIKILIDNKDLAGIWFSNSEKIEQNLPKIIPTLPSDSSEFAVFINWLDKYFKGEKVDLLSIPINPLFQTPFRLKVWHQLIQIPFGHVKTYGEIAKKIEDETKQKASAQAVGGAIGANPILLIIPCHRVISASGDLTGYSGGIDKKAWLINHEQNKF
ncbi:methylated-DNA--[protein]-cysteine S-methyltransferase [Facklamia sp. 7083-14-GEN3]|uniref:methylated-DNA--[protein]-cysteine S-methyltransferase n=1 Tax=Facklamia sp. 7083-14-GEN3 TaxID=2973478 RepID=UPI00215D559A|nr:methylated-DNA--[protein]-cysteine S-methyltransferase [Facklamia sp. 7083-14-GEN3]MCR8968528.1 methylated-DNA--[protein]-cysteine S-methyltransferase [Facklamia sp. 7083-14-GEN3]